MQHDRLQGALYGQLRWPKAEPPLRIYQNAIEWLCELGGSVIARTRVPTTDMLSRLLGETCLTGSGGRFIYLRAHVHDLSG